MRDPKAAIKYLLDHFPGELEDRLAITYGKLRLALDKKDIATARTLAAGVLDTIGAEISQEAVETLLIRMSSRTSFGTKIRDSFSWLSQLSVSLLTLLLLFKEVRS